MLHFSKQESFCTLKATYLSTVWYFYIDLYHQECQYLHLCKQISQAHTSTLCLLVSMPILSVWQQSSQSINVTSVAQGVVLPPLKKKMSLSVQKFQDWKERMVYNKTKNYKGKVELVLLYIIQDYYSCLITHAFSVLREGRESWKRNLWLHIWRLQISHDAGSCYNGTVSAEQCWFRTAKKDDLLPIGKD